MSVEEIKDRIAKLRDATVLASANQYVEKIWSDAARRASALARKASAHSKLKAMGGEAFKESSNPKIEAARKEYWVAHWAADPSSGELYSGNL